MILETGPESSRALFLEAKEAYERRRAGGKFGLAQGKTGETQNHGGFVETKRVGVDDLG